MKKLSSPAKTHKISTLILTELEYCHVINKFTGQVNLIEGPYRRIKYLWWKKLYGTIREKIIIKEGQYATIINPHDSKKRIIKHGVREIRQGPCIFSLYPGEILEDGKIYNNYVLAHDRGLIIRCIQDYREDEIMHKAGDIWMRKGPMIYYPHIYTKIEKEIEAISLGAQDGLYIKNFNTGQVRLEKGPQTLMLTPFEELYYKHYSIAEQRALKILGVQFDASRAIPLKLETEEIAMINSGETQRVEIGPKMLLLEPFDRLKTLIISGKTPKMPNILTKWKIFLGPMFVSDQLCVRTKDNAELLIHLRYKTRFNIDPKNLKKIFAVEDFIGYATETMASIIRQEAAQHNFEEFHSKAAELIEPVLFKHDLTYFRFEENYFEIFGLDIKKILPQDAEIANQLNAAIKSNMDVYVNKIQQTAQLEAERQLVEGRIEIEDTKQALYEKELANFKFKEIGNAKIEAEASIERTRGEMESIQMRESIVNQGEELHLKNTLLLLESSTTEEYLRLQQVKSFQNVEKTVILPTDSKIFVPMGDINPYGQKKQTSMI
ncbi:hypothetical protein [Candidatus Lokiarchaeum ossiferum]|uniref:hypothetical protein n=1 Tax=Candidatus Lokiarchaeum ossiferum TaxID=2951803 RepID=UPI00352F9310